jgi:CRISPR-associated protein Csy1
MPSPDLERSLAIRAALHERIIKRRSEVLAKITGTDAAAEAERKKQTEFFQLGPLLRSGAACVSQIQMATHIVKGSHPDPRIKTSTNLNVDPSALPDIPLVGSHSLGRNVQVDATGNGAFNRKIFEIFSLLQTRFEDSPILTLLKRGDADATAALSDDPLQAAEIASELAGIDEPRCVRAASHTLAKQIYWPVGPDPHDDSGYHLLAPLYPTSLVHRFYLTLQEDRFGEPAKAAREARKTNAWHERPVREYPNLAVQQLGGTKPQNISQLNSERRGDNCLLASLPPVWQSLKVKPLLNVESLFKVFGSRREVRTSAGQLRQFLAADPAKNIQTRQRLHDLVDALLDELMQFTAEVHTLDAGWSADSQCDLPSHQCAWLDPDATDVTQDGLIDRIASDFANWLNAQLRDPLPIGDAEYLHWRKLARDLFKQEEREATHGQ